jgi:hypothetical protein
MTLLLEHERAAGAAAAPAAPDVDQEPVDVPLERGRAEVREEQPDEPRGYSPPGPRPPRPPDPWGEFPRFRGGDGNRLPRWQRIAILGVLLFISMLIGWLLGTAARVFARGLEDGRA